MIFVPRRLCVFVFNFLDVQASLMSLTRIVDNLANLGPLLTHRTAHPPIICAKLPSPLGIFDKTQLFHHPPFKFFRFFLGGTVANDAIESDNKENG